MNSISVRIAAGILLTLLVGLSVVEVTRPRSAAGWLFAIIAIGVSLLLPVIQFGQQPGTTIARLDPFFNDREFILQLAPFLTTLLAIVLAALLFRAGGEVTACAEPTTWSLGLALAMCMILSPGASTWLDAVVLAVAWVAWWWLLPPTKRGDAARLAAVSAGSHTKLVRSELRRRLAQISAHDYYRKARSRLGNGELKFPEYDLVQRPLDQAASSRVLTTDGISSEDALSTSAGSSSWSSALSALQYALPLALILTGYEIWLFFVGSPTYRRGLLTLTLIATAIHAARWLGYAFVYGYFFPLIRGRGPVPKSLSLGIFLLAIESLQVLASIPTSQPGATQRVPFAVAIAPASPREVILAVLIRVGQVIVFCTVLGLLWERRLARRAGLGWDRVRNVRSLRALATPIGTVLIAVITTAGTALAGAAVAALLTANPPPVNTNGSTDSGRPPATTSTQK